MPSFLKLWTPVVILTIVLVVVAFRYVNPAPPTTISIATGRADGVYYQFAQQYQSQLRREGFELAIVETAGSTEALELLRNKQVDMAFVQGGVAGSSGNEQLVSLASLFYEPVWLFHSKQLENINYLSDLEGTRIAIGEQGSGTATLATTLLAANDIEEGRVELRWLNTTAAFSAVQSSEIDALISVMNASSPRLIEMFQNPDIELMSFRRALAYSRQFNYLTPLTIGEGMISLEDNVPNKQVELIAATANLVATTELHRDLVRVVLKTATNIHKQGGIFERNNEFPNSHYVEIPMDKDAELYLESGDTWLERTLPFSIATNIKRLIILILPLLTLLIPLVKGALPLYRWRIRFKIFRWYEVLKEIDARISQLSKTEIEEEIVHVTNLLNEVNEQTNVPLSYMGEYYDLQLHINLVLEKLERVSGT